MYRLYVIHHVTKREVESGWKSRYYAAILGGKEDRGLWIECKYNKALCKFTVSSHVGKLIHFGEW